MNQRKIQKLKKKLRHHLDKERYEHTLGVMYTAGAMAMAYQIDIEKAIIAGLLHDCAKCFSSEKKLKLCQKYKLPINAYERKNPGLLHAKLGACLAKYKYKIRDLEILEAIQYHTTGRPNMTMLDKIVYIADYIEPNRDFPGVEKLRELAKTDLDAAMLMGLDMAVAHVRRQGAIVGVHSLEAIAFLTKGKERNNDT